MVGSQLAIVIPAFNEQASVGTVVDACRSIGVPVVVDDGSSDNTGAVASKAGAVVVRHARNRGYDAALNSGLQKASELGCDFAITIDADGQHDPALIADMLERLVGGADIIVGVRDSRARIAERLFGWLTYLRFGLEDPFCGLKGYRMSLYRSLGYVDSFGSVGTELTIYALRHGYRLEQIPVRVRSRLDRSRFGNQLRGNLTIIRAMLLTCFRASL